MSDSPAAMSHDGAALQALEDTILALLEARDGSICPSEAARQVGGDDWRKMMDATRVAGCRLAERGAIVVTQRGRQVDARRARGPIRYALAPCVRGGGGAV